MVMMVGKGMEYMEGGKYRTKDIIKLKNVFTVIMSLSLSNRHWESGKKYF